MNKNSIIGLVLIGLIMFGLTWYQSKQYQKQAEIQAQQDSIYRAEMMEQIALDSAFKAKEVSVLTYVISLLFLVKFFVVV